MRNDAGRKENLWQWQYTNMQQLQIVRSEIKFVYNTTELLLINHQMQTAVIRFLSDKGDGDAYKL